jgi:acyl-CoA synthetase (AMP-forming)/AMP-acid ligase II
MTTRSAPLRRHDLPDELADLPASVPEALQRRLGNGDDPFVVGVDFRLTFAEADARSAELAGRLLASGVGKGSRVGLLFANGSAWAVTWLALARLGALTVPLSTFAPGAELARMVRQTDLHALVMGARFGSERLTTRLETGLAGLAQSPADLQLDEAPFLRWVHVEADRPPAWSRALPRPPAASLVRAAESEVTPADALAIINTSGATAAPKSVVHTHGSLVRHAALLARRRGLTNEDRIYSPMPFFWVGGLTMVLLAALVSGAAAVTQERFEPGDALDLIERERVTQVSCWPNAARQMADHPTFAARDLRWVRGGTLVEALPPEYRPPSADRAPNVLGMTETGGPHTSPDDPYAVLPEALRGTMGRSLPGMEHMVVDLQTRREVPIGERGELLVRGAFLMKGFYKRERHEVFTPDGWYATGDEGWFGADGHLRFSGRRTAMIKTGGSNVSPAEVESALVQLPDVRDAFVFGIPAGERGEDVAAVVVPERPDAIELAALQASLRDVLSSYKIPRHLRIIEEVQLPKLPTGKVDLTSLRDLFAEA